MGSSRPVTPASPRSFRVKASQPGVPVFGCEHCRLFLETRIEILKNYTICLQHLSKAPNGHQTWLSGNSNPVTSLTPTYLCLQCSVTTTAHGRIAHGEETYHRLYVESRSGALFCHMCDDFVWDPTLEELRMQKLGSGSFTGRKRKHEELFTGPGKDDPSLMSVNTVEAPCRSASGLRGIYNMGATCYMNVILQSFVHNPLLRNFYLSEGHPSSDCQKTSCMSCSMDAMFQDFYAQELTTGYSASNILANFWFSPRAAYVELASNKEQDAHEFFTFLTEELHEIQSAALQVDALVQPSPKRMKTGDEPTCKCIIHQTFYGKLQSMITCQSCLDVSLQVESFLDLSLGLDILSKKKSLKAGRLSLQKCLDEEYKRPQTVEYKCRDPSCGAQAATKQLSIKSLPNVLCIQLKRFGQQRVGMGASKIDTKVSFPLKLEMFPYTTRARNPDQMQNLELARSCTYDLQTVVVHVGNLETGHYVSYSRVGNQWFKFNDHKVTLASKSQVLNEEAFLLFYVIQSLA